MANYLFEQMSASDAAGYDGTTDELFFLTGSPSTVQVAYAPANGLQVDSLTLTSNSKSLTFSADGLGGEVLHFFSDSSDQSTLALGSNTVGESVTVAGAAGSSARYYGLGGNDTIVGSLASDSIYGGEGNDTITGTHGTSAASMVSEADYLNGGNGADSITGSAGNDHIYGNSFDSVAGDPDGNDTINAGDGNDYVNGNAGNDVINGLGDNDRLYGGAGNDTIDGGDGNDYLQGNKGADSLIGGNGIDELHGGADADTLLGGNGNDALFGDNGNDSIVGGAGYDKLTGGAGNDVFSFAAGDASNANAGTATTAASHGVTDQILDFIDGQDTIHIATAPTAVVHGASTVTATDVSGAQVYAQQLMDNDLTADSTHTHDVAAVMVGADTYLFFNDTTTNVINSVIKVVGVADSAFTVADFV